MKENKKKIIYLVLFISVTITALGIATFAYFMSNVEVNANIPMNVATANESVFTASSDGNIAFDLSFEQMTEAGVSTEVVATNNATITVKVDSENEREATTCTYDIVWVWDSEDKYTESDATLPYTQDGKTYNYEFSTRVDNANEKDLSSLSWQTKDGKLQAIVSSEKIIVGGTGSKTNTHEVDVRTYNLPVNQTNLFNKIFKAHLTVENVNCTSEDISKATSLATYVTGTVYNSTPNQTSIASGAAGLYKHDSSLANGAQDGTYRYAGGLTYPKASEGYDAYDSIIKNIENWDTMEFYYLLAYDETNTKYSEEDRALNKAVQDGYIEEVNNYVCFMGDDCTQENNLYRIISVNPTTNQTKVIKATSIGNMKWNDVRDSAWVPEKGYTATGTAYDTAMRLTNGTVYYNIWAIQKSDGSYYTATLNQYLNTEYLKEVEKKTDKIATTTWSVKGASDSDLSSKNIHDFMQIELNNAATYEAKIGLMYGSEYGYAALPEYWTNKLYYSTTDGYNLSKGKDWMYTSNYPWTVSRSSGGAYTAFNVYSDAGVSGNGMNGAGAVRPSFNLSSSVKIINADAEGVGSKAKPMILI